ncbi:hypothetical protein YTPLAS21_03930 [Candidatus Nitrosocosmicus sp.]|uniref:hypothetical protein n=1 Tax=Candidatus Nitrosocosmicus sp. FF01 TaxID=3397670 RepID=UPI00248E14A3|nr:hypothetical protein [Nitrosomonas nitrosa]GKS60935.1 hypothetical protein YTPLAS21_03930 [Candidatus Nitrosocosmicus sp.]
MIPESCSFAYNGTQCPLPPQFIIEILDESNNGNKFMIGLTCPDHKEVLEKKFLLLQGNNVIPAGKIVLTPVKIIHTDCVKGTLEDEDEVKLKRMKE